jgi:tetratricopeptide (TPR) repeat protein
MKPKIRQLLSSPLPSLGLLCFIVITVFVYLPGLKGDYVFDDFANVLTNDRLNVDSVGFSEIKEAALSSRAGRLQRPVSMLSFSLNRSVWGIDPFSYKLVNLIIHILNGIGLYFITVLLARHWRERVGKLAVSESVFGVVVAGIWLIHPINLTSVLYIVQRMTSLSALFAIGAIYFYCSGRERLYEGRKGYIARWVLMLLLIPLSVLSKENGILIPVSLLAIEVCFFRFKSKVNAVDHKIDRNVIALFIIILVIPGAAGLFYVIDDPQKIFSAYSFRDFTLVERLLTECRVLFLYLKLILVPNITELGLYHDDIVVSRGILEPPATLGAVLGIVAMLIAGITMLIRRPSIVGFGLCWFFAWHILESTVIPLELAHEHRNYLASYGILLIVVYFFLHLLPGLGLQRMGFAVITLAIPILGFVTYLRAEQWSDNISQATYEAIHHPESPRAIYAAARIYANITLAGEESWEEKAVSHLLRAAELDNSGILPETSLILLMQQRGKEFDPKIINDIAKKLYHQKIHHNTIKALKQIVLCVKEKRCNIAPFYIHTIFENALNNVHLSDQDGKRANIETIYAEYFVNVEGNLEQGEKYFKAAITHAPKEPQYYLNFANFKFAMKEYDEATKLVALARKADHLGVHEKSIKSLEEELKLATVGADE